MSFSGSRTRPAGADPESAEFLDDAQWARGFIDVLLPAPALRSEVAAAVRLLSPRTRGEHPGPGPPPAWPADASAGGDPGTDAGRHSGTDAAAAGTLGGAPGS